MPLTLHLGRMPYPAVPSRTAVRAIAVEGDRVLLLVSRNGDVKFPGGGVEPGETLHAALSREVREECGARIAEVDDPTLVVHECRRDRFDRGAIFSMTSHYFRVTVETDAYAVSLSPSERSLGLEPRWLTVDEALAANQRTARQGAASPWVGRENLALRLLRVQAC